MESDEKYLQNSALNESTTSFTAVRVRYVWKTYGFRYWPKGEFTANSPAFHHPTSTKWCIKLQKDSLGYFYVSFLMLSSEVDLPLRASVKALAVWKGNQHEVPTIDSYLFKVGNETARQWLKGFSQPKEPENDWLRIECEVQSVRNTVETSADTHSSLAEDLTLLLKLEDGADVTLQTKTERLLAHSAVLRARSSVLASILRETTPDKMSGYALRMDDLTPDVVKALLRYIYFDCTGAVPNMAEELLIAASRYDVRGLKRRCEQELASRLTVTSAAGIAVLAITNSCLMLAQVVIPYIQSRSVEVMGTPGWTQAVRESPNAIAEVSRLVSAASRGESIAVLKLN